MGRLARTLIPGHPHHVTQRGNGHARTFFSDPDYALYRDLLGQHCRAVDVEVWAWCLMPNYVHLILCRPTRTVSNACALLKVSAGRSATIGFSPASSG
jgi:putative transposase